MSIPVAIIHCRDQIFSPYSGLPADPGGEPNTKDPTLLFIYHGVPGIYTYVSKRLEYLLNEDVESIVAGNLHDHLDIDGGLILEVVNDTDDPSFYGFAPKE
jgi:hypothetical protein